MWSSTFKFISKRNRRSKYDTIYPWFTYKLDFQKNYILVAVNLCLLLGIQNFLTAHQWYPVQSNSNITSANHFCCVKKTINKYDSTVNIFLQWTNSRLTLITRPCSDECTGRRQDVIWIIRMLTSICLPLIILQSRYNVTLSIHGFMHLTADYGLTLS